MIAWNDVYLKQFIYKLVIDEKLRKKIACEPDSCFYLSTRETVYIQNEAWPLYVFMIAVFISPLASS